MSTTAQPTADDLRPKFEAILGTTVYAEWDTEYPECLCAVVLGDVDPAKMEDVCDVLRKAGNGVFRLCANIIEDNGYVKNVFESEGFAAAFEASWDHVIATVRMG
jgi:hypothetical protein